MSRNPHWLLDDLELLERVKKIAAEYEPTFRPDDIFAHDVDASYDQATFRFYQAGSSLSSPTAEAAESVDLTLEEEGNGNYALQLWIVIEQTDSQADLLRTKAWKLQVSHEGGTYTDIDSSVYVNMVADSGFADGDAITALPTGMTAGNGSFINGEAEESTDTTDSITFTQNAQTHTVCCWSIEVVDAQVGAGETLDFRVVESDSTVLANNATSDKPRITWNAGATNVTSTPTTAAYAVRTASLTLGSLDVTSTPATAAASVVAPTFTLSSVDITSTPATAAWGAFTPSLQAVNQINATAVTATFSAPAPSLTLSSVPITAAAVSAAFGLPTASLTLGAVNVTSTAVTSTWVVTTATLNAANLINSTPATAAFSAPAPSITLSGVSLTPAALTAAFGLPTGSLTLGATDINAAAITAAWAARNASITEGGDPPAPGGEEAGGVVRPYSSLVITAVVKPY